MGGLSILDVLYLNTSIPFVEMEIANYRIALGDVRKAMNSSGSTVEISGDELSMHFGNAETHLQAAEHALGRALLADSPYEDILDAYKEITAFKVIALDLLNMASNASV